MFAPFISPLEIDKLLSSRDFLLIKIINMKKYLLLFSIAVFLFSCNKDEEISQDVTVPPVIELDSEDGIYVVKIGKEVVIEPILSKCRLLPFIHGKQRPHYFR